MKRLVLDTNVVVSSVLSPHGPCASLLAAVLTGSAVLIVDARVFDEYTEVLARPKFRLPPATVKSFLQGLHDLSEWILPAPLPPALLPDPDDLPFLELAISAPAALVTGNFRHFPKSACRGAQVLDPASALRGLAL